MQKRMYFLVIYQLSGIQAGIQAGHCSQQYDMKYKDDPDTWEFVRDHTTWYVMNGGTVNENSSIIPNYRGSLNLDLDRLKSINYKHAIFREPDLGDQMTAICFICDERVFNKDEYPDFFFPYFSDRWIPTMENVTKMQDEKLTLLEIYEFEKAAAYQKFVDKVGIEVATLKDVLKGKRFF